MMTSQILETNKHDLESALSALTADDSRRLDELARKIANGLNRGSTIFWCGNGGSAAESQHMAAELMGRFLINRSPYRSLSLTTDTSAITGISNDFSFDEIFSRQIQGMGRPSDFLISFTTSGKSANVLQALRMAKTKSITTISFLGGDGGDALALSDYSFVIKSNITARIQEVHTLLAHTLCQSIESIIES